MGFGGGGLHLTSGAKRPIFYSLQSVDVKDHRLLLGLPCTARATDATASPHTHTVGERQSLLPQPIKSPQDHSGPLESRNKQRVKSMGSTWPEGLRCVNHHRVGKWIQLGMRKRDTAQRSTPLGLPLTLESHLPCGTTELCMPRSLTLSSTSLVPEESFPPPVATKAPANTRSTAADHLQPQTNSQAPQPNYTLLFLDHVPILFGIVYSFFSPEDGDIDTDAGYFCVILEKMSGLVAHEGESGKIRVIGRRMDGLREDHKQAIDDKEQEVKVQKGSEKQELPDLHLIRQAQLHGSQFTHALAHRQASEVLKEAGDG
ncbi:hypothetical protein INR49_018108 [Caranx melampygus]|nr:hypothetical protein INR49_018108 [Caranx melampygus]